MLTRTASLFALAFSLLLASACSSGTPMEGTEAGPDAGTCQGSECGGKGDPDGEESSCNRNGICEAGEDADICPVDCPEGGGDGSDPACDFDGTCDPDETAEGCPADCPEGEDDPACDFDGTCDPDETAEGCPADCPESEDDVDEGPMCVSQGTGSLCSDSCGFSSDGVCDDGGSGSSFSLCDLGSDCCDCGARCTLGDCTGDNICAEGDCQFAFDRDYRITVDSAWTSYGGGILEQGTTDLFVEVYSGNDLLPLIRTETMKDTQTVDDFGAGASAVDVIKQGHTMTAQLVDEDLNYLSDDVIFTCPVDLTPATLRTGDIICDDADGHSILLTIEPLSN